MTTFYVDSKMAWCTVAGGFVANFLLGGLAKSYGLIMEAYQEVFQSGSAYLQLAGGLIYTLMYCLSLVNHYISERYGSRPVVIVGAIGSCVSLLVAAFAPTIALWVIAIGVGLGSSLACIYFTVFSVVGRCFRRYLGLANGISVAGVSVGQIAFPSMITYFNEVYGTRNSTVIMAAICLHLLITAVLMPRYIVDPDAPTVTTVTKKDEKPPKGRRRWHLNKRGRSQSGKGDDVELTTNSTMVTLNDETVLKEVNGTFDSLYVEVVGKESLSKPVSDDSVPLTTDHHQQQLKQKASSKLSLNKTHSILDSRLSKVLLLVYILAKVFGDIGDVSISFVAPTHGSKMGFSPMMVSRAIAVAGMVDLVSRLGVGWLTDRPCCVGKRGLLLASIWILTGFNSLMFAELYRLVPEEGGPNTYLTVCYFICFGIHGVCSGTAMTQMVVVLADWVGSARLAHSLAITMVVLGILIAPSQFAIGYLADVTNSYVWPLRVCCIIMLLAGIILLLEFPVRWFHANGLAKLVPTTTNGQNTALLNSHRYSHETDVWITEDSDDDADGSQLLFATPRIQPGIGPVPLCPSLSRSNIAMAAGDGPSIFIAPQSHTDDDDAWSEAPVI